MQARMNAHIHAHTYTRTHTRTHAHAQARACADYGGDCCTVLVTQMLQGRKWLEG